MERFNRKIGKIAFTYLLVFLSLGLLGQEEKFLLKQGNEAYEDGEYDKADQLYNEALKFRLKCLKPNLIRLMYYISKKNMPKPLKS
jgi:hypothetical protein